MAYEKSLSSPLHLSCYCYWKLSSSKSDDGDSVTIMLKCPRLSSYIWCIKLYATVCGGCGTILSFLWLIGHFYVLSQTQDSELKTQRYLLVQRYATKDITSSEEIQSFESKTVLFVMLDLL